MLANEITYLAKTSVLVVPRLGKTLFCTWLLVAPVSNS